jgi:hypothetical protein
MYVLEFVRDGSRCWVGSLSTPRSCILDRNIFLKAILSVNSSESLLLVIYTKLQTNVVFKVISPPWCSKIIQTALQQQTLIWEIQDMHGDAGKKKYETEKDGRLYRIQSELVEESTTSSSSTQTGNL